MDLRPVLIKTALYPEYNNTQKAVTAILHIREAALYSYFKTSPQDISLIYYQ